MTEKRALELSIELWENLKKLNKENPTLSIFDFKIIYFSSIVKNNPKYKIPLSQCHLCEYAQGNCEECPVKNWNKYRKQGKISKYCTDYGSVYRLYPYEIAINEVLELLKETYNDLCNK